MPRVSTASRQLVEVLAGEYAAAIAPLPPGYGPGAREHRETLVRIACELAARKEVRISGPLIRALIGFGSPNDINDDMRRWQRDMILRSSALELPAGFEDIAKSLEDMTAAIIRRADDRARESLSPLRAELEQQKTQLAEDRKSLEAVAEDARQTSQQLQQRVTGLEAQLAVERSLREAAETARADTLADLQAANEQREAMARRMSKDEEKRRAEIEAFQREVKSLRDKLANAESSLRARADDVRKAVAALQEAKEQSAVLRGRAEQLEAEKKKREAALQTVAAKLAVAGRDVEHHGALLKSAQGRVKDGEKQIAVLQARLAQLTERLAQTRVTKARPAIPKRKQKAT